MEYTIHTREKFFARAIDSRGSVPTEQKEKERREMEK